MPARPPHNYSDERLLLNSLSKGSEDAFAFLFDKYYSDMVMYGGTFIAELSTCEDIVQNIFFNLWDGNRKLIVNTSLKSYMMRAVRNSCLDELRHRKVKHIHAAYELRLALKQNEDTEKYVLHSDLTEHLEKAILKLPEPERQAFEMNRIQNMKPAEIAEVLDVSLRTVQLRISKAVSELKVLLKDFLLLFIFFMAK